MDEYDNDFEDDLSDVSSINGQPPHELQESSSFLENRSRTGTPTVEASNGPIASEKTSHSVHKNHGLKSDKRTPYKKSNLSLSNLGNRTASNSLTKLKTKPPNTTGTRYNKQRKTSIGNSMSMPAFEELMRLQSVIDSQKTLIAQLEDERKTLKIVNQRQEREIQRLMKEQGEWPRLLRVQAEE
ncbi:hypothetical protein BC832DRAFT_75320 [Gaertneriomyces semiglobifer]|nr:hypothetical protein BC832DRAFT_75320 [Gaertneriomyces semiglobifer]